MELVKSFKQSKVIKFVFSALIGSIILAISSKIRIPFYPVPMTMQTFVVIMLAIALGSKVATSTILLYLFEGLCGLPVFSNSPEKGVGLIYFTGPTMGYLIGFIFATYFAGKITLNNSYLQIALKIILSVVIIYCLGLLWLGYLIGWDKPLFDLGAKPFLLAETFKVLILIILAKYFLKFRRFI